MKRMLGEDAEGGGGLKTDNTNTIATHVLPTGAVVIQDCANGFYLLIYFLPLWYVV